MLFDSRCFVFCVVKVYMVGLGCGVFDAGQRARVPPDPIPNSEVKPCSVPNCSAVFGRVNSGKLALLTNLITLLTYARFCFVVNHCSAKCKSGTSMTHSFGLKHFSRSNSQNSIETCPLNNFGTKKAL